MKINGHKHAKLLIAELEAFEQNHIDDGNHDCPEVEDIQTTIEDLQKAFFETNDDFPIEDVKEILFSNEQERLLSLAESNLDL